MPIFSNSGLVLAMESARAAAQAITTLTNANPGIVGLTAHGYVAGDLIFFEVEGMTELNGRLFEVVNETANDFELKNTATGSVGIDTSAFGVFTNGTMAKVTLGTNVPGVQEFTPSGGEPKLVDTTTVSDKQDKQIVIGSTAAQYALSMQWDPSDAAQIAMQSAFELAQTKGFKITWPGGRYTMFIGTIGFAGLAGGANQDITTSPAVVALNGLATHGIP